MKSAKNQTPFLRKERTRFHFLLGPSSLFFFLTCLTLFILFCIYLFHYFPQNTTKHSINAQVYGNQTKNPIHPPKKEDRKDCNLFKGQWIRDSRGSLYTNYSCKAIPRLKNCFLQGRKDTDFLHWRWKPDQCEIPRFSPGSFLATLRGKTMAFIGDSLARNQMESLVCLLSMVEAPKAMEKDSEDRITKWEFLNHNFTLMALWSQFLVASTERVINGSATGGFDLHLDKIDSRWSEKLPSIDYAIFSDAHWFLRQNYLYEGGNLIGCIYCDRPNVTALEPGLAIRRAFRAAFREIINCKNCKKITAFLRTYSPAHFENGTWNTGGGCNRTWPLEREAVGRMEVSGWEFQKIQVEEIGTVRRVGEESGIEFGLLDITEMMVMRADGHPGVHWGNQWMKGYSDCIHWCLPGPIDAWNELLFELVKRHSR